MTLKTVAAWAVGLSLLVMPALSMPPGAASPQAAVDAAYAVISGPNGRVDRARFEHLFTPTAHFVRTTINAHGDTSVMAIDRTQFIAAFKGAMGGKSFYETGQTIHADVHQATATILSDYQSRHAPNGPAFERGRNTFELIRGRTGWQVDSVFWEVRAPR